MISVNELYVVCRKKNIIFFYVYVVDAFEYILIRFGLFFNGISTPVEYSVPNLSL